MSGKSSRDKGARWERSVTNWLISRGWIHAERRPGGMPIDRGDILGIGGVLVECKDHATLSLSAWVDQAERAAARFPGSPPFVVIAKRKGRIYVGDSYAITTADTFARLLTEAGYGGDPEPIAPVLVTSLNAPLTTETKTRLTERALDHE